MSTNDENNERQDAGSADDQPRTRARSRSRNRNRRPAPDQGGGGGKDQKDQKDQGGGQGGGGKDQKDQGGGQGGGGKDQKDQSGGSKNRKGRRNKRRRGRRRGNRQRPQGVGFWGDAEKLPPPDSTVRLSDDPAAVPRSLGHPPLPGNERIAQNYFELVYTRAATTAGAVAAAGGLIEPDELVEEFVYEDDPDDED